MFNFAGVFPTFHGLHLVVFASGGFNSFLQNFPNLNGLCWFGINKSKGLPKDLAVKSMVWVLAKKNTAWFTVDVRFQLRSLPFVPKERVLPCDFLGFWQAPKYVTIAASP